MLHVSTLLTGHHQAINAIYKTMSMNAAKFILFTSSQVYVSMQTCKSANSQIMEISLHTYLWFDVLYSILLPDDCPWEGPKRVAPLFT